MDLGLKDKLAFVSGSTAGIGFAIAIALAGEGARVVVNGRTQPAVDAAIAEIRSRTGADAYGFAGDLSLASTAAALFRAHPDVEILVNNFGIFEPKWFEDIADAEWVRFFEANVLSGVRLARLYLPAMRRANWGRIIFISSESAVQIPAEMIHYGMTKTAQLAVSRGLAEAVAGTGITVNSVLPGPTKSRGVDEFVEALARTEGKSFEAFEKEFFEKVRPTSLIKRFASPGREHGGLSREPVGIRDHRRRRARRRRGDQERILIRAAGGLRAGSGSLETPADTAAASPRTGMRGKAHCHRHFEGRLRVCRVAAPIGWEVLAELGHGSILMLGLRPRPLERLPSGAAPRPGRPRAHAVHPCLMRQFQSRLTGPLRLNSLTIPVPAKL